jgi:hypothetical protein
VLLVTNQPRTEPVHKTRGTLSYVSLSIRGTTQISIKGVGFVDWYIADEPTLCTSGGIPMYQLSSPGQEQDIVKKSTRKIKRRRTEMTDRQLLADARRQLRGRPSVTTAGMPSSVRTRAFSAKYQGLCARCGRFVNRGDEIRFHRDFSGFVHSGCRAPEVIVTKARMLAAVVTGSRDAVVCSDCHLEHRGPCW